MGLRAALLVGITTFGGCSDARSPDRTPEAPAALAQASRTDAKLAYTHDITIGLPPDAVTAHFTAARDRCQNDAALGCVILRSSINEAVDETRHPRAHLRVRLPHASVASYTAFLTTPLPGEAPDALVVRDQSTQAEDLTRQIDDGARKLAQLNDYRTRLTALSAKADIRVEDLIRVAQELAETEARLQAAEAGHRTLNERIDTEIVSVTLRSDSAVAGALAPVAAVWARSARILGDSAGLALRFAVAGLPWLPIAAVAILLLRALRRLLWRGTARPAAPPTQRSS